MQMIHPARGCRSGGFFPGVMNRTQTSWEPRIRDPQDKIYFRRGPILEGSILGWAWSNHPLINLNARIVNPELSNDRYNLNMD